MINYIISGICSSQLFKEIELCSKITKVIQFDRDESCMIGYGRSILDGVGHVYIWSNYIHIVSDMLQISGVCLFF